MKKLTLLGMMIAMLASCSDSDVPGEENEEEIITDVVLTFTPANNDLPVVTARAEDPDGEGPEELAVTSSISLVSAENYNMSITLTNGVANEDITAEVEAEGAEHMFFFEFTPDMFSNPAGNGNVDNRADAINYSDVDAGGLPVGLETSWTTGSTNTGTFRVILKHQPGVKSATSTFNDGETDVDLTFDVIIQ